MNKFFRILAVIPVVVAFCTSAALAQDKILLRGKVTEKGKKAPLVGVSIAEKDKDNRIIGGTMTDLNGQFSITVRNAAGEKLEFSYMGFKPATRIIGSEAVINVELEEATVDIDEVVVQAHKKVSIGSLDINERDMTFAYSKLDAKEVDGLPVSSIDQALQGRLSGVDLVATSGEPGAGMAIRIRGTASINNSADPLIVVNGIPYESTISEDFDFATADEETYSQLLNISPSDIQDITVLKDAASTAMYGSKGANGVLLITTKRGAMGKPRLQYSFKGTVSVPRDAIPTLNGDQYTTLILEEFANARTPIDLVSYPEFARDPNNAYYFYNYGQNTDWVSEVLRTSFKHEHNMALSGGGEKAQYRISMGYLNENGNIINSNYNRFTTTINLNYSISDNIHVVAEMSYVHGESKNAYPKDILGITYTKMPNHGVFEYTESGELTSNYFSPPETPQGSYSTTYNPVAMAYHSNRIATNDRVRPQFTLRYRILPELLEYKGTVNFDISNDKSKSSLPQAATGRPWTENTVNRTDDSDGETFIVQVYNTLSFTPKIGKWATFNILGKLNTTNKTYNGFSGVAANTASIYLTDPSNPSRLLSVSSGLTEERQVQATGFAGVSVLDRYLLNVVLTADGNSRFGPDYRWGLFPSISARYRISSEPFMRDMKFINDFSLRASYGQSGKAPKANYLYYNRYSSYSFSYLGEQGVYPSSMQLNNLRWEIVDEMNLGFNFIGFNNRLNVDLEYYRKTTNDLMFSGVAIPSTNGVDNITMNVGSMRNNGWELSIFTTPLRTKDWNVDFRFTLSQNQNMVIDLSDNVPLSTTPTADNGSYMARVQEGNPLGSFYGYRYKGVYLNNDQTIARDAQGNKIYTVDENNQRMPVQMRFWYPTADYVFEAGDAKYEDINHDGNINYMDIVYLGNANPTLLGGFGPTIRYKKWSLSTYFYFRYGFDIVNSTKMNMESMYDFDNQSTAVLRRWQHSYENPADAPSDLLPRALYKKGYNWAGSDRYVEDGSFMKFKSATLRYTFDKELVKKIGLTNLDVTFTAYNLFTWTNYTGMNPEVSIRNQSSAGGIYSIGYDNSRSPSNIEFMLGVNVTF